MAKQEKEIKENIDSWEKLMFLYNAAIKKVRTELDIMNDEFQYVHKYNPMEYIKSRIKTPESIVNKLKRQGHESNIQNMVEHVNDIAGVRVVCSFTSDIYQLAELIRKEREFEVLTVKDYLKNPKSSGYRSYHMLLSVPIHTSADVFPTKVELQIRTIAMDFWASLEHKIYYKFEGHAPEYISKELKECADIVSQLDNKMYSLNEIIRTTKAMQKIWEKDQIV